MDRNLGIAIELLCKLKNKQLKTIFTQFNYNENPTQVYRFVNKYIKLYDKEEYFVTNIINMMI